MYQRVAKILLSNLYTVVEKTELVSILCTYLLEIPLNLGWNSILYMHSGKIPDLHG